MKSIPLTEAPPACIQRVALKDIVLPEYGGHRDHLRIWKLADSLKRVGQLKPVRIMRVPDGRLLLVDGRRTVAAVRLLGWETVDAVVVEGEFSEAELAAANACREPWSWRDRLELTRRLRDAGYSQRDIASILGMKAPAVSHDMNVLRLVEQLPAAWEAFEGGALARAHLVALARARPEGRAALLEETIRKDLSSKELEDRVMSRGERSVPATGAPATGVPTRLERHVPFADTGVCIARWDGDPCRFDASLVPSEPPHIIVPSEVARALAVALEPRVGGAPPNVLLTGPAGDGKTSYVFALAHCAGAPLVVVQGHADLRDYQLTGRYVLKQGAMEFEYGAVALAMARGYWCLIDEISAIPNGALMGIFNVLAGADSMRLDNGEVVRRAPGFRLFATSNTLGSAAARKRRYAGSDEGGQNDALLSRFGVKIQPPSLDAAQVTALLCAHAGTRRTSAIERMAAQVASFYLEVRRAALDEEDSGVEYAFTVRELLDAWHVWLTPLHREDGTLHRPNFFDVARYTFLPAYRPEEQEAVLESMRTHVEEPDVVGGAP